MINTIPPALDFIPKDDSSLSAFGTMLNKLWQKLSLTLTPVFVGTNPYTPVLTAFAGTFTTSSATGRYMQYGQFIFLEATVSITTVGTGTFPVISLPVLATSQQRQQFACRENLLAGFTCVAEIGFVDFSHVIIEKYDGSVPSANGTRFNLSGFYEAA